ncbi:hypothetical protein SDC9_142051 [bioreactor metagenome]|uniref:Uncharacterized protein n=1 Tax=bioreactor metagenome TaxID=1076179 RepID=A0A645E2V4_9ZZZZ
MADRVRNPINLIRSAVAELRISEIRHHIKPEGVQADIESVRMPVPAVASVIHREDCFGIGERRFFA